MDASDETLNGYLDWVATKTRATVARHTNADPAMLVQTEILLMMDSWDQTQLRKRLAEYGVVSPREVEQFLMRGFHALYTIAFDEVATKKHAVDLRNTYLAMGYEESFINLLFLVVVEYLIDKPYDEIPHMATINNAQERVGDLVRLYLASHDMTMPEHL